MKRRKFGLMAGSSLATLSLGAGLPRIARAGVPVSQADTLKTTLTPFGAERAGNADGSIPAWTGGLTQTLPGWTVGQKQPDYFASDAMVLRIDQSNVAQYADSLADGTVAMINKYPGFNVQVFPTHRTAAAPQWVYDNMYKNALNSSLDPRGGRFGFLNAYGGVAFPILDSDPKISGAQVIWNHLTRWEGGGPTLTQTNSTYIVANGNISLGGIYMMRFNYPYYDPKGSAASFDGWYEKVRLDYIAPPVQVGQVLLEFSPTNALNTPTEAWELLNGQGRVRKAPELTYDTPSATGGGINNYDDGFGFYGSPDRYNWTYLGKREIYVPYNNNKLVNADPYAVIKAEYLDPDAVRFEKHRVHVIDAILAPGERHTFPHRRFYVDEDQWHVVHTDSYDAAGNLVKVIMTMNVDVPNAPGTLFAQSSVYNIQTREYTVGTGMFVNAGSPGYDFGPLSPQLLNPQDISAQAQY